MVNASGHISDATDFGLGEESTVVSDQIDPKYEPTPAEVREYGAWLGMDPQAHRHLMWIAREALKAPLPKHWKLCQSPKQELFYFHFRTGESSWDHPSDTAFKALFERYRDTPRPAPQCDAEGAAVEVELGQLLRRARQLGLILADSVGHVLENVATNTIGASEYVQWWRPRVAAAEQQMVSAKLAQNLEQLKHELEHEQLAAGGHLWATESNATAALELAVARLTPAEREALQGNHHAVVEAWQRSQQRVQPREQGRPDDQHAANLRNGSALKDDKVQGEEASPMLDAIFKPMQSMWGNFNINIFGLGRSQTPLLPV
eukprot:SAG11_NODE_1204_length_5531_cov_3.137518_3_plen_318_part_00